MFASSSTLKLFLISVAGNLLFYRAARDLLLFEEHSKIFEVCRSQWSPDVAGNLPGDSLGLSDGKYADTRTQNSSIIVG